MNSYKKIIGRSISVIGLICLLISLILAFVFVSSVLLFLFGWFMFGVTGNMNYFSNYLWLNAFYTGDVFYGFVQALFLLDYIGLLIGASALPSFLLSCITIGVGQIVQILENTANNNDIAKT